MPTVSFGFASGYQYTVHSAYADFYIADDWYDMQIEHFDDETTPYPYEKDFLRSNYAQLRDYFVCLDKEMKQYQDFFGFENYNDNLPVYYENKLIAHYEPAGHSITIRTLVSFSHEYIHSLSYAYLNKSNWIVEGFASLYMNMYATYGTVVNNSFSPKYEPKISGAYIIIALN